MSIVDSAVPGFDTLDFIFAVPGGGVFFPCCHPLRQCHKLILAVPSSVSGFQSATVHTSQFVSLPLSVAAALYSGLSSYCCVLQRL